MRTVVRFLVTQIVILALGAGLIWIVASPLASHGSGLDSIEWAGPIWYAVFWGALAGSVEGLFLARRHLVAAVVAAVLVTPFALWLPLVLVGDWGPDEQDLVRADPADLVAALVGWALFVATSALVAPALGAAVGRTRVRSAPAPQVATAAFVVVVVTVIVWLAVLS